VTIEIDGSILNFLEQLRWLREADAHDVSAIAAAIEGLLALSAKVWPQVGAPMGGGGWRS
jgi:hypothetical protein